MTSSRLRRRVRALTGRGLRLLRTHFFSFISAGVIGGIFVYAMTSSSFSAGNVSPAPPVAIRVRPTVARAAAVPFTRPAIIVYYIVRSKEQRDEILAAMQGDQLFRAVAGNFSGPDEVDFFIASTPEEDLQVAGLVSNALDVARQNSVGLRVIDIRGD
ncbi:MAG TPA: hypothetical protein VFY10_15365 [Dehalococcoidia bacterium]|nr:hypothetical protein [Dehalococcoidia bacterium]